MDGRQSTLSTPCAQQAKDDALISSYFIHLLEKRGFVASKKIKDLTSEYVKH
jgi:hypothetical protein